MGMVLNNEIKGVLPVKITEWNGKTKIYYDITGLQPIKRVFSRKKIGMSEISQILFSIGTIGEESKRYLLDISEFIFSPDYIYWNMNDETMGFIYYPEWDNAEGLEELSRFILENIDNDDHKAVRTAYEFYKIIRENMLDIEQLFSIIKYERYNLSEFETEEKREEAPTEPETERPPYIPVTEKKKNLFWKLFERKQQEKEEYCDDALDFSGYEVLPENAIKRNSEETVLISLDEYGKNKILKSSDGKEIPIPDEDTVIVGSKADYVDISIEDNPSVSKMHAQIYNDGKNVFISDLNSLNGTFVNGRRVEEETKLNNTDSVAFGNAEYTFLLK